MDINLVMKWVGYFVSALMIIMPIYGIVLGIVKKNPFDSFFSFCILMFSVFMESMIVCGGSAFLGDASVDYELYEAGHYYLCSHGNYTEVSYEIYTYMQIIEIVGMVFWAVGFVLALIKIKKENGSFFARPRKEKQLLGSGWKTPFSKE